MVTPMSTNDTQPKSITFTLDGIPQAPVPLQVIDGRRVLRPGAEIRDRHEPEGEPGGDAQAVDDALTHAPPPPTRAARRFSVRNELQEELAAQE